MMRSLIMVSILTLSGAIPNAQQITVQDHNGASLEELIGTAITSGGWDGHMQKQFGKLGDSAAVSITKVIPERSLSPTELDAVLAILAISFADPALVDVAADREPRTTLFVLRHLDLVAPDANERKKIGDTRTYVKQQFEKYRAKMNAEPAKNLR